MKKKLASLMLAAGLLAGPGLASARAAGPGGTILVCIVDLGAGTIICHIVSPPPTPPSLPPIAM